VGGNGTTEIKARPNAGKLRKLSDESLAPTGSALWLTGISVYLNKKRTQK
jgi:hypothetical protein